MSAFYDATQELGVAPNVTTFTESDFSRTFQPTTAMAAINAWGSHHLVLGGAVQGGQIFGKFPTFELGGPDDTDVRGRWIPLLRWINTAPRCALVRDSRQCARDRISNFANSIRRSLVFLG